MCCPSRPARPFASKARVGATASVCPNGAPADAPRPGRPPTRLSAPTTPASTSPTHPPTKHPIRVLIDQQLPSGIHRRHNAASSNGLARAISLAIGGQWAVTGITGPAAARRASAPAGPPGRPPHHRASDRRRAAGTCVDVDLPGQIEVVPLEPHSRLLVHYKYTDRGCRALPGQFYDVYRGSDSRLPQDAEGLIDTVNVVTLSRTTCSASCRPKCRTTGPPRRSRPRLMAARSYALDQPRVRVARFWDVFDTTQDQVYLGVNHEKPETSCRRPGHRAPRLDPWRPAHPCPTSSARPTGVHGI